MTGLARATAVAMVVATPAFAHHGWGGKSEEVTSMTGTVVQGVSKSGPHATMKLKVDAEVWEITLAPPARAARSVRAEGLIPVVASVTVLCYNSLDAKRHVMKSFFVSYGERQFH